MEFGYLKSWWECVISFSKNNFWSLVITVVLLLELYFYLLIVKKVNIFTVFHISFPKELMIGKIPITVNRRNRKLAYNIWVELKTRKIALDFDEENDVIVEVYNSWYDSFKLIREYIKDIGEKPINNNLRLLSLELINETMRPHLTKYQSRFRSWFEKNYQGETSVQETQKKYPEYDNLVEDLREVNKKCQKFLTLLEEIYR